MCWIGWKEKRKDLWNEGGGKGEGRCDWKDNVKFIGKCRRSMRWKRIRKGSDDEEKRKDGWNGERRNSEEGRVYG